MSHMYSAAHKLSVASGTLTLEIKSKYSFLVRRKNWSTQKKNSSRVETEQSQPMQKVS